MMVQPEEEAVQKAGLVNVQHTAGTEARPAQWPHESN